MKTLELENYGVQEMSANELKEVNGGADIPATKWWHYALAIIGIALIIMAGSN